MTCQQHVPIFKKQKWIGPLSRAKSVTSLANVAINTFVGCGRRNL